MRRVYFELDALQTRAFIWVTKVDPVVAIQRRALRFMEEAVELVQALGVTKDLVLRVVDYVYGRPAGEVVNEIGGVGMTLLPLCEALDVSAEHCFRRELHRVNTPEMIAKVQARQVDKAEAGL